VGEGVLLFLPAVAAATLGSVLGAWLLYAIGRFGGRTALLRWGRYVRLTEAKLDRADRWFDHRGHWIVLGGRLIPGVRSLVSLPAGASEMPFGRFTLLTALGSGIWNAALIGAGWALGANWERVGDLVGPASRVVLVLGALALAGLAARTLVRRRGMEEA
jgi:membrane protein DedA with SNARE-associated domain